MLIDENNGWPKEVYSRKNMCLAAYVRLSNEEQNLHGAVARIAAIIHRIPQHGCHSNSKQSQKQTQNITLRARSRFNLCAPRDSRSADVNRAKFDGELRLAGAVTRPI